MMKISFGKIAENIGIGIVCIIIGPFILLYMIVRTIIIIPKYGFRMAFLKYWNEEKFDEEVYRRDKELNGWPTDPVERAKMPRLKLAFDFEYEFSTYANMSPRELVYVASEKDVELEMMLANHLDYFNKWAEPMGMRVVYLPTLYQTLISDDVCNYRIPTRNENILPQVPIGNDYMLQYLIHPEDREKMKSGFLWSQNEIRSDHYVETFPCYYFSLSSSQELSIEQQLEKIKKTICGIAWWIVPHVNCTIKNKGGEKDDDYADNQFNSQYSWHGYENIEDLMEEIKERVLKLRQRGVAEHILEELIHPDDKPSRMVITKDYRILLPDFNNMEIKMEPLVKAVYLLFLNHPKGLLFKHLPDYRKELTKIYMNLRPTGLSDRAIQSIEDVTNPLLNSINEKCARIRGAFLREFDDHIARHYYIDGLRGERKKISLDRDLVTWE